MVNVPGTDERVVSNAEELVRRLHDIHEPRGNLGTIVFNNLRVYPGTPLARQLSRSGSLGPDAQLLFPMYHDPEPYRALRYELEALHQQLAVRSVSQRLPDGGP
jgi:hypothetical protein